MTDQLNRQDPDLLPVTAIYAGVATKGMYHLSSAHLDIIDGPAAGKSFRSPSGAACAVVQSVRPNVNPNRNGWTFWRDEEGNLLLVHRRFRK